MGELLTKFSASSVLPLPLFRFGVHARFDQLEHTLRLTGSVGLATQTSPMPPSPIICCRV